MSNNIHSTAIISAKAKIGENVSIGPFVIVEDDVEIGNNTKIETGTILFSGARIGKNVHLFPYTMISGTPQDLKYNGEPTLTYIGDNTVIREFATINKGTDATGKTSIGSNCLIMSYCHIAHDCSLGDNIIMSNSTQLGGHVVIEDWVVVGGVAKVHQFCRIGKHAMIGADVKLVKDVAPFTLVDRKPAQVEGVNKIGLRRRGFSENVIKELQDFYDTIIFSKFNNQTGITEFKKRGQISEDVKYCIDFIENSVRGIHR